MSKLFRFKQFVVDQTGCAMKINTDGVLLGALAESENPGSILDIGTGTGVISLMLAQRFQDVQIEAVEIDEHAAATAKLNFFNSPFDKQLACFHDSFENYFFKNPEKKFDLIVSNPPFFLNSLKNPDDKKKVARHTDESFIEALISLSANHLSPAGVLWLILPIETIKLFKRLAGELSLYEKDTILVRSFEGSKEHRNIISFSKQPSNPDVRDFVIYAAEKQYSEQYKEALRPFFTIF